MRKIFLAGLTFILFFQLNAQTTGGIVLESLPMESKILKKNVNYTVYLPPGYETSSRTYPVVYLLHGYSGNDTDWVQFGQLDQIADKLIADESIPPMIIVTPDGRNDWYVNYADGTLRYEDMFVQELIPFIESKYRVRPGKEFRAISGLSMGGHGSLIMALRHPDLFAVCAPLSAAIYTDEQFVNFPQDNYDNYFGQLYGKGLENEDRLNASYLGYSAIHLVMELPPDTVSKVKFYIDCGDKDYLTVGNSALHALMWEKKIPHEYRVREGSHNWTYWREALPDALKFISKSFTR